LGTAQELEGLTENLVVGRAPHEVAALNAKLAHESSTQITT
jgi:hypothetical protein